MAIPRLCSIIDCGKPHFGLGLCNKHYKRAYRQRPKDHSNGHPGRHAVRFYSDVVVSYRGDECLVWPFARSSAGYSNIGINGKTFQVHRLACEAMNGPPPSDAHEAAHTCGQGRAGCVNPRHLVWKTHRANEADKLEHGTHIRGERHILAKLSEVDVRVIRTRQGVESSLSLSRKFGVSPQLIRAIWRRKAWAWLT